MQLIRFTIPARFACVAALAIAGGACAPSDPGSATGGRSGATGGVGMAGTGGSTNVGTGGDAAGTGGADATGGSGTGGSDTSGTGGGATATGGSDASGGAGGRGQSTGGAAGGATTGGGCGAAAFCDDFERTMLGTDWVLDGAQAATAVAIDTAQHHSGMSSAHIKYGTAGVAAFLDSPKGYPFPNDTFWGRVWLYAKTTAEPNHHVYIDLMNSAQKSVSPNPSVRILNTQKMSFIATNTLGDKNATSAVPMPQDKWSCFEWHITAMGGKGTVELYLDGTVVPGTSQMNVSIPNVDRTRLGMQRFGGGVAAELWYDDYAVGAARIGCN